MTFRAVLLAILAAGTLADQSVAFDGVSGPVAGNAPLHSRHSDSKFAAGAGDLDAQCVRGTNNECLGDDEDNSLLPERMFQIQLLQDRLHKTKKNIRSVGDLDVSESDALLQERHVQPLAIVMASGAEYGDNPSDAKTATRASHDLHDWRELGAARSSLTPVELITVSAASAGKYSDLEGWASLHNKYRCMHGLEDVEWSDELTKCVKDYGEDLTDMIHDPKMYEKPPPCGPAGENLFWQGGELHGKPVYATAAGAVSSWYFESNDCNPTPQDFKDGCAVGVEGRATGHFTAMIWNTVKKIGCTFSKDKHIAYCKYWAGAKLGESTPNTNRDSGNYISHVVPRIKTEEECGLVRKKECATIKAPCTYTIDYDCDGPASYAFWCDVNPVGQPALYAKHKTVQSTMLRARPGPMDLSSYCRECGFVCNGAKCA